MTDLTKMRCVGCEGGILPLTLTDMQQFLPELPHWQLSPDHKNISRQFTFKGFYKTMSFVNAIAWIANQENHHPDMAVGYNYCTVTLTTHAINGLSKNDFICAAKIDGLLIAE